MKKMLVILLIVLINFNVFSADKASFTVKAFKVGLEDTPQMNLVITDAISDSLDASVSSGKDILLDSVIKNLYSSSSDKIIFKRQVVFSYRVEGNCKGSYELGISIGEFAKEAEQVGQSTEAITSYCVIGNKNKVFSSTGTSSSDGFEIKDYSGADGTSDQIRKFYDAWTVTGPSTSSVSSDPWLVRGAIAIGIDKPSYENAEVGVYKAPCTVTIKNLGD